MIGNDEKIISSNQDKYFIYSLISNVPTILPSKRKDPDPVEAIFLRNSNGDIMLFGEKEAEKMRDSLLDNVVVYIYNAPSNTMTQMLYSEFKQISDKKGMIYKICD